MIPIKSNETASTISNSQGRNAQVIKLPLAMDFESDRSVVAMEMLVKTAISKVSSS
jgi:hypothetical protein